MDTWRRLRDGRAAVLLVSLLFLVPSLAQGQLLDQEDFETGWRFTSKVGLGIPGGELSGFLNPGPTFGLGGVYYVNDRVGLTLDGDVESFPGKTFGPTRPPGPDTRLWHLETGGLLRFTNPQNAPGWVTTLRAAGGITYMETDPFGPVTNPRTGEVANNFSEMYLGGRLGFTIGYRVTDGFRLSVGSDLRAFAASEDATAALQEAARLVPGGIAIGASIPVYLEGQLNL